MSQSVDDTIVLLMSMGFDIKDCQDAINFGKNTVESAVEWIVAGKPGFHPSEPARSSEPSLRLRPHASEFGTDNPSASFQKPYPIPENINEPHSSTTQSDHTSTQSNDRNSDTDQSEVPVVSRLHLSDSQRKYKENYEQKKLEEAKKQAVLEKRKQKEAHARVLKEIAEDREKKKLLQPTLDHSEAKRAPTDPDAEKPKEQKSEATVPSADSNGNCLLQIRLPDGRTLRQSFQATSTLRDVWEFTAGHHLDMYGYVFIQPFPRHEYTQKEMMCSLAELKLTPTGSLVLQKKQVQSTDNDISSSSEAMDTQPSPDRVLPPTRADKSRRQVLDSPSGHRWGQGHALDSDREDAVPVNDDLMEEGGEQEDNHHMVIPGMIGVDHPAGGHGGPLGQGQPGNPWEGLGIQGGIVGQHMPPPMGNILGQGNDMFGMQVAGGPNQAFGGVGQRLVPLGDPSHNDAHLHRSARELALERAEARKAQPSTSNQSQSGSRPVASTSPNTAASASVTVQPFLSLVHHCLKHIMHRLNDPRHQLLSLAGIPESLAQAILEFLIKEKQLKPKTLNAFIPCYLRKLVLDCYPYATNELLHSVRLHANLSHLSLSACPLITDAGLQCLTSLKKLKKLNLSCCKQLSNKCVPFLISLKNLVSLNLEATGVNDSGVIEYVSSEPEHLQLLNLSRTPVTQTVIPHIQKFAKQLKSLNLEDTKVMSLSGIEQCANLETLNVARTSIVTESLFCLARHSGFRSLNIANTDNVNGDEALKHLAGLELHTLVLPSRHTTTNLGIQYISGLPLTSLDLTNYILVGDEAMEYIGKMITLKQLILSNTKLTDVGMFFLEGLRNLEVLNVDRTLITDEGARVTGAFVNLVELSMASTKVTTRFLLSRVCNNCTNLSKLNLSKTLVTKKGVLTLELPCLQMINLDGTKVTPDLTVAMVTGCPNLTQMSLRNLEPFTKDDELEEAEMGN